jgi:hypothetical protein
MTQGATRARILSINAWHVAINSSFVGSDIRVIIGDGVLGIEGEAKAAEAAVKDDAGRANGFRMRDVPPLRGDRRGDAALEVPALLEDVGGEWRGAWSISASISGG